MQCGTKALLRAVICWGRDWCLDVEANRDHVGLTSRPREQASACVSLPHFRG